MFYRILVISISVSLFSLNSSANSPTCEQVRVQCDNAVNLGYALSPYFNITRDFTLSSLNLAHARIKPHTPQKLIELARNHLDEEQVRNYFSYTSIGLGSIVALKIAAAVFSVPLSILRLPVANRPAALITGIAIKSIYDSYLSQSQAHPAKE